MSEASGLEGSAKAALIVRLLQMLDPRQRLAVALGWSITLISLVLAAATGLWTVSATRNAIEAEIGQLYSSHARRLIETIDANLAGRRQWIAATGRLLGASPTAFSGTIRRGSGRLERGFARD